MKILLVHSDFIEYEAKNKAIKSAEKVDKKKVRVEECLVVFSSAEKGDEKNKESVIKQTVKEIKNVLDQVKADKVVLYPFVHLTSEPAKPATALEILNGIESALSKDVKTYRSPFGWYKSFDIKCKGHPLSELSRSIVPGKDGKKGKKEESEALKKEETLKSYWHILDTDGKLHELKLDKNKVTGFDFSKHKNLGKFCKYEMAKSRQVDKEPPHIKLMRKLQLVDYEEGSDPGNLRYLPNGRLIKGLLEDFVTNTMVKHGALEVETPIMYDFEHPSLKSYMHRFPARQYTIETPNKNVFLRFAACFGQFLIAHDTNISYKNLPLWMYEMTKYSFRVEQRGELAGLRRLRAFTMPDCHSFCKDIPQAKKDMLKRFELAKDIQEKIGISIKDDLELGIRVVKDFYEENKEFVHDLAKGFGKPVLIEMWDKKFFYFLLKYEFNFVDCLDKAAALTTDQIDVENGERYGIVYQDSDNKKKHPIILHLSPSGAIERVMYALLERCHLHQQKGKNPLLPMWLAPTQVRLCPVNDTFIDYCKEVMQDIEKHKIRTDIDDRAESVGKKIRDSEKEWIPLTIVVGEKEKDSGKFAVRFRETGKVENLEKDEIISYVRDKTKGMPYRHLALPKKITKRPIFIG
ncbi:threonine--tRNA ligase [Candidatus Aenigmatarchaeota archaeon]